MSEQPVSRRELWRQRLKRLGARLRSALPFAAGVAAAFVALWAYQTFFPGPAPMTTTDIATKVASVMASATAPPPYSSVVYQVIQPSIVLIQTKGANPDDKSADNLGSGVIVNDSGAVLTSLHVVANAADIQLTFADGTTSGAVIANRQPENDIAVLAPLTPPVPVVPATLGNPGALRVGDEAYVVGNPLGLYSSMTAGVISGLNRTFTPPNTGQKMQGLIQIDAAVNPGNSGGPLLNRAGQVVGIVTALINPTNQDVFIGIGLAVPINTAASGAGLPPD